MRSLHRQEVDDLTQQVSAATKAKHSLILEKDSTEASLQREKEASHRVEDELRSSLDDAVEEKAVLAGEVASLQARLAEQQGLLQVKVRSLQEAQESLQSVSNDTALYGKRYSTTKKQLEESEGLVETLRTELRDNRRKQSEQIDELYRTKRQEVEEMRRSMEQTMEKLTQERSRLLEENISMKRSTQVLEDRSEEAARALSKRDAEESERARHAEAKHKSRLEQMLGRIESDKSHYEGLLSEEGAKVAKLTQELAAARESGSMSMQKLLEMFQKTQLDFQAQLADEAQQAKKRANSPEPASMRSPLSTARQQQQLSQSLSEILKQSGSLPSVDSSPIEDKENRPLSF
eukprot:TRINITY_DN19168_c0_g1_i1.p1 TRINITY_DN19168_c0_g1~~TRINITY_DN19168_c0_g1_i1.p1  ORF type:complete len:401 (+),score=212.67 TRINITY_DN19168_c0_g1_i1:162-1205(+)